jgi:hypothetical protein
MNPALRLLATLLLTPLLALHAASTVFDPCDFGAKPDGQTLCTEAIQKAVDACAAARGGTVRLAGGRFLSGTIYMRSHVTIEVAAGAKWLGSTNIAHYPHNRPTIRSYTDNYVTQSLIYGENLQNVGLTGRGVIDGQGASFSRIRERPFENRPYLIRLINCRDVLVEGLRLQNSAMWMQHYLACERVIVRGIRVSNFSNYNNDGIDLDGCKDCIVSQCIFESDDDGITLKSTLERPSESITISDCIVRSHCNAIKAGTESNGGFKDITITNCVVTSPSPEVKLFFGRPRGISGISLELVDGGKLEQIAISNITIRGVTVPLFLRLGDRARPFQNGQAAPPTGSFKDVMIQNIVATETGRIGCSITGLPGHPIENVSLSNVSLSFEGGGSREAAAKDVEEHPKKYPEATMFGELPAFGLYSRHVSGLRLSNVQLRTTAPDPRHAVVCDDVERLMVDGLDTTFSPGGLPMLSFRQVREAMVRGCQPRAAGGTFLRLAGDASRDVVLTANDLSALEKAVESTADVRTGALRVR